jgi:branched-chain amino acid transport system substrate-binding protein
MMQRRTRATGAGGFRAAMLASLATLALATTSLPATAEEPLKIGFGMAETGPLAGTGKSALLAMTIWAEDVNAKGGLLGRQVKLVHYDDQSNPANVPALYAKLIDLDKVDLIISGYATPIIASTIPIAMQHDMVLMGFFGLANNAKFKYDKYFGIFPSGEKPALAIMQPFFDAAMTLDPKPKTVAIVYPEMEFGQSVKNGARAAASAAGLQIVYDQGFPPSMTDLTTVVRQIQATNPDIVAIGTQPGQSIAIVRAINEVGLKAKVVGGGMTGLQTSDAEGLLGEQLNGFVNFNIWLPAPKMQYPGVMDFIKRYQERAPTAGVDPIGYYAAPWAYAELQVLGQAVEATKSTAGDKLGPYMHANTFKTIVGDVKFAESGEWAQPRMLAAQFQHVKGNDIEQFKSTDKVVVISPAEYKSGELLPFDDAHH